MNTTSFIHNGYMATVGIQAIVCRHTFLTNRQMHIYGMSRESARHLSRVHLRSLTCSPLLAYVDDTSGSRANEASSSSLPERNPNNTSTFSTAISDMDLSQLRAKREELSKQLDVYELFVDNHSTRVENALGEIRTRALILSVNAKPQMSSEKARNLDKITEVYESILERDAQGFSADNIPDGEDRSATLSRIRNSFYVTINNVDAMLRVINSDSSISAINAHKSLEISENIARQKGNIDRNLVMQDHFLKEKENLRILEGRIEELGQEENLPGSENEGRLEPENASKPGTEGKSGSFEAKEDLTVKSLKRKRDDDDECDGPPAKEPRISDSEDAKSDNKNPSDRGGRGDPPSPAAPSGSLLDDFADTSTEMPDYTSGED